MSSGSASVKGSHQPSGEPSLRGAERQSAYWLDPWLLSEPFGAVGVDARPVRNDARALICQPPRMAAAAPLCANRLPLPNGCDTVVAGVRLVPEVPHSRQHHRQPQPVGGVNDFLIPLRAAALGDRGHAVLGDLLNSVREREERILAEEDANAPIIVVTNWQEALVKQ